MVNPKLVQQDDLGLIVAENAYRSLPEALGCHDFGDGNDGHTTSLCFPGSSIGRCWAPDNPHWLNKVEPFGRSPPKESPQCGGDSLKPRTWFLHMVGETKLHLAGGFVTQ